VTDDCRIEIGKDGHSRFQRGTELELDISAAGGWSEIDGSTPAQAAVMEACWGEGTTIGRNDAADKHALERLQELVKVHLLGGGNSGN